MFREGSGASGKPRGHYSRSALKASHRLCDCNRLGNSLLTVSRKLSPRPGATLRGRSLVNTHLTALTTYDLPSIIKAMMWMALWCSLRTPSNNPICLERLKEIGNMACLGRGRRYLVRDAKRIGEADVT